MLPVVAIIPRARHRTDHASIIEKTGPATLTVMTGMSQRAAMLLDVERDTRSRVLDLEDRQFDSQKRILGDLLDHGVGTREQAV